MACYAHPDDESFGAGGVMAKYSSSGARCLIVTASRGEFGPDHRDTGEHIDLGDHRLDELAQAARTVGAEPPVVFGLRDGGIAETAAEDLRDLYLEQFRIHRPDVVVTFDKTGVTGHSDHIAVHKAVTAAFEKWNQADARLFYNLLPNEQFTILTEKLTSFGIDSPFEGPNEYDGSTVASDGADGPRSVPDEWIDTRVDIADFALTKKRAIASHKSQMGPDNFVEAIPDAMAPVVFGIEYFQLAAGDPRGTADDLFGDGADPV